MLSSDSSSNHSHCCQCPVYIEWYRLSRMCTGCSPGTVPCHIIVNALRFNFCTHYDTLILILQITECTSAVNFKTYVQCDLMCVTSTLSRCVKSSPSFEAFMRESPDLAIVLRQATECCFDSDSGHAVRRTCSISQAMTHTSVLAIWLPLVLLGIIAAIIF